MRRRRPGLSMLELVLFLGILSIMSMTLVAVFIASQEARIRQQGIAALEQRSGQILEIVSRRIRRAEKILLPLSGQIGATLALQMSQSGEYPTIFSAVGGTNLWVAEKDTKSTVLNDSIRISNLTFRNVNDTNVVLSFDLAVTIALPNASIYQRHYDLAVTLFPTDQMRAGGCIPACTTPICTNGTLNWKHCENEACVDATNTLAC